MRTPDGHSRLELSSFLAPPVVADHRNAPVNSLGYLRVMFAVDDIDETLARLRKHGAELVSSEVVQYEDSYRLCYIRGPEGLLIGLAQELGSARNLLVRFEFSRLREAGKRGSPKNSNGTSRCQIRRQSMEQQVLLLFKTSLRRVEGKPEGKRAVLVPPAE